MSDKGRGSPKKTRGPKNREVAKDYQIFISHATADKWIARMICEKLEAVGAKTFRDDRDIHGGDDIPDEIRRQIKRSKELVVLITPQSAGRPWILFEAGGAWISSKSIRIVTVLYHVSFDSIPAMLKSKKAMILNDIDHYFSEVAERVKGGRG